MNKIRNSTNAIAVSSSIFLSLFYAIQLLTSWSLLNVSGVRGQSKYIDQDLVLKWADCFSRIGNAVYSLDANPRECGGFQYSVELLRFLNGSHLVSQGSFRIGTTLMWTTILLLSGIFFLIKHRPRYDFLVAFLALASPGIWLLLERGNYDELMLILVIVGAFMLTTKFQLLGVFLIGSSVLIKFYTLPLLLISIFVIRNKKLKIFLSILTLPFLLYVLYLIKLVSTFPSTWNISFGLKSVGLYINFFIEQKLSSNFRISEPFVTLMGLAILGIALYALKRLQLTPSVIHVNTSSARRGKFLYHASLIVFLSCYFAGMNFDYRLVYLALIVGLSPIIFEKNRFSALMVTSGLGALWFSTFSYGLNGILNVTSQIFGDFLLIIFVATQLIYLVNWWAPEIRTRISLTGITLRR